MQLQLREMEIMDFKKDVLKLFPQLSKMPEMSEKEFSGSRLHI